VEKFIEFIGFVEFIELKSQSGIEKTVRSREPRKGKLNS